MRCAKARELFFGNYDGLLDEAQKMKLQEHLDRCPRCASFAEDMEKSLGLLKGLPEMSPSENFGWNLKRRILHEKAHLMRQAAGSNPYGIRWGMKFAASAAAVVVVALVGSWFLFGEHAGAPWDDHLAEKPAAVRVGRDVSTPRFDYRDLTNAERAARMRMVSGDAPGLVRDSGAAGPQAFQDAASSREDSLLRENEYLRWYIQRIDRENLILRQYLYRVQSRR
jgi:hypothetical protein